jgi:hypothetical protein
MRQRATDLLTRTRLGIVALGAVDESRVLGVEEVEAVGRLVDKGAGVE